MSAFAWIDPTRWPRLRRPGAEAPPHRTWVGVDLSGERDLRRTRALVPLLVLVLAASLAIAALRIDLIRTRYALATVLKQEQALLDEQRALIVRKRQLRDPVALAIAARERGFRPPMRVITLPEPRPEGALVGRSNPRAVGAGPTTAVRSPTE